MACIFWQEDSISLHSSKTHMYFVEGKILLPNHSGAEYFWLCIFLSTWYMHLIQSNRRLRLAVAVLVQQVFFHNFRCGRLVGGLLASSLLGHQFMSCRCKEPSIAKGKSGSQKTDGVWKVTMSMWSHFSAAWGCLFVALLFPNEASFSEDLWRQGLQLEGNFWGLGFPEMNEQPCFFGRVVWKFLDFDFRICVEYVCLSFSKSNSARCPIKRAGREMSFRIGNIEPQRRPPAVRPTRPWSNPLEPRWLWWDLTLTVCHFLLNCGWELCHALMSWKFAVVKIPPRLYGILWIGRTRFGRSCASSTFHPCIHPFAPILWDAQSSPMFPACSWDSKTSLWRAPFARKPRCYSHLQLPKL